MYAYLIIGKEFGDSGTPHLQGFVQFCSKKSLVGLKKFNPRIHWEATKGSIDQNIQYCSKANDFMEYGIKPMDVKQKAECGKRSLEERWKLARSGQFEQLAPENIKVYEYIYRKNITCLDRELLDNQWIWGPSGCGKSKYVRDTYPTFYLKPMSKWWDGYNGEDVVCLDDVDPKHAEWLGYFLKIWCDHYVFNAEVKGCMLRIRPKTVIVTSQFPLEIVFPNAEDREALSRRFTVLAMGEAPKKYHAMFNIPA